MKAVTKQTYEYSLVATLDEDGPEDWFISTSRRKVGRALYSSWWKLWVKKYQARTLGVGMLNDEELERIENMRLTKADKRRSPRGKVMSFKQTIDYRRF